MFSRVVLLGLVGALGVTLPSQPEAERWLNLAQSWTIARIADWDTWSPRLETNRVGRPAASVAEARGRRAETPIKLAWNDPRPSIKGESATRIPVASLPDLPANVFAEGPPQSSVLPPVKPSQLTEKHDAVPPPLHENTGVASAPAVPNEGFSDDDAEVPQEVEVAEACQCGRGKLAAGEEPVGRSEPGARSDEDELLARHQPTGCGGDVELDILAELYKIADQTRAPGEATSAAAQAVDNVSGCFDAPEDELVAFDQSFEAREEPLAHQKPREATSVDSVAVGVPITIGHGLCVRFRYVRKQPVGDLRARFSPAPSEGLSQPLVEPMEIGSELPPEIFYELNRVSEVLRVIPPEVASKNGHQPQFVSTQNGLQPTPAPSANKLAHTPVEPPARPSCAGAGNMPTPRSDRDPSLDRAFRLTRDALLAWMNVLVGPPLVKVTAR